MNDFWLDTAVNFKYRIVYLIHASVSVDYSSFRLARRQVPTVSVKFYESDSYLHYFKENA